MDRLLQGLPGTPAAVLALVLLVAPLALTLYLREERATGAVPSQEITDIPQLPVLIGFGTAMGIGRLLHRRSIVLESFARRWRLICSLPSPRRSIAPGGRPPLQCRPHPMGVPWPRLH